jgi:hypothetical protein
MFDTRLALATLSLALLGGCALLASTTRADPSADFAAHRDWRGIVVDRMAGGGALLRRADDSVRLLQRDGATVAALSFADDGGVAVHPASGSTAVLGEVWPSWRDGVLRLSLRSGETGLYHTSSFRRVGSASPPQILAEQLHSPFAVSALPGVYRAELRDDRDAPVGWVRVHIHPYVGLPRDYDADVPPDLDGPLVAGAVALLDAAIDAIAQANAYPQDRWPGGLVP